MRVDERQARHYVCPECEGLGEIHTQSMYDPADCHVYKCPECGEGYPRRARCCGAILQSEDDMCRCDALEFDR